MILDPKPFDQPHRDFKVHHITIATIGQDGVIGTNEIDNPNAQVYFVIHLGVLDEHYWIITDGNNWQELKLNEGRSYRPYLSLPNLDYQFMTMTWSPNPQLIREAINNYVSQPPVVRLI